MRITIVIFLLIIGCNPNKSDYTIKGKYEEVLFAGIENGNINFVARRERVLNLTLQYAQYQLFTRTLFAKSTR